MTRVDWSLPVIIVSIILLFKCNHIRAHIPFTPIPEDAILNFTGLARKYGHPADTWQVETQDGHLLELYHLQGKHPTPILLMHGFQDSADTWILRGKDSLAIDLANKGYDVWLGNTRGNRYTRHVQLERRQKQYWEFSIHELGYYDLPAIIDTVLKHARAQSLTAIGHSQGNAIFYILGSTRPEYNAKVNLLIALSPICYMHNTPPPVSLYLKAAPVLSKPFKKIGIYGFLEYEGILNTFIRKFCSRPFIGYVMCAKMILFPILGFDNAELEPDFYQVLINHLPAGTSWMNYEHFGQIGVNKRFASYDFGIEGNLEKYNSTTPPTYDLKKVTMPVALFAGRNDPLSDLKDVKLLKNELPNLVKYLIMPHKKFTHGDSVWGKHMHSYLFPYIYSLLEESK